MLKRILPFIFLVVCLAAAPAVLRAAGDDKSKDKSARQEKPLGSIEDLPRDAKLALFDSQQLLEKGETQKAVDQLGKYVHSHEKKDDNYVVRYQYAAMLMQVDKREDALKEYERVVQLEPRYDAGWMGIGETAYGLGQYAKAADALMKGYDLSTDKRPEVLYYAAAARLLAGDPKSALPLLEDLTSGKHGAPKFEWYRGLVSGCLQAQDAERGKSAVDAMLEKFPNNPDAWYLSFQYYASVSDYRQAAVSMTILGYLRPLTRQEQLQLGDLYAAVEAPAVAAEHYAIATQDSASSSELERVASAYLASYQSDRALTILNEGLKKQPTFQLWSLLGDLQVMEKRFDEAYKAFDQCVKLDPDKPRPYLMLGYCALELNDPDKAMEYLNKIADNEEFKDRVKMLIQRAQIMRSAPTPDGADDDPARGQAQSLSGK
jgi:tetratricopeptide (TPR) repeat protein